ncbi:10422_t:CDS:2 [Funneliformis mosseae]|uniref:10422_t:CDS:1 n=1 Tax=Funneliformis mosseae TaxID=27381 RepID=A0A9N9HH04_FUNMO|nr:10422_t:CDS:2 [Funneliformis mosseae]
MPLNNQIGISLIAFCSRNLLINAILTFQYHWYVRYCNQTDEIGNNGIREWCFNYLNVFFDRNMHSIPFTAEGVGDFCNTIAVIITFDNRSAASDNDIKLEEEIAFCLQILFTNLMLGIVLKTITMDKYKQQQQNGKTAAFLLYVDETNKL